MLEAELLQSVPFLTGGYTQEDCFFGLFQRLYPLEDRMNNCSMIIFGEKHIAAAAKDKEWIQENTFPYQFRNLVGVLYRYETVTFDVDTKCVMIF